VTVNVFFFLLCCRRRSERRIIIDSLSFAKPLLDRCLLVLDLSFLRFSFFKLFVLLILLASSKTCSFDCSFAAG